jgi:hypothetical protein
VALGDVTADGSVLLAKNSDRAAHEAQRLLGVPAGEYAAQAPLRCQYITIPQVSRTAALIGSQPYWLWGFEHGMNEYGVAIGNEAIHTREAPQEKGLLGMDLVRLGLERGTTAREALDAITALLEQFGQGGSTSHHETRYYDNSFIIADPREAWVLETAGRHWVGRHLIRGYYSISNRPTIGAEYDLVSDDLIAYAEGRGWWERGRRPFDFAAAYTDPDHSGLDSATCRMARSRHHLRTGAPHLLAVADMMALLRDHGPATDGGSGWLAWPDGQQADTVCMHGPDGGTAASMVAHLVPGARPTYWASMAPPCTGVFAPCWVDTAPPSMLAHADETPDAASPWWHYRRLWEAVSTVDDPGAAVTWIRASWRSLEEDVSRQVRDLGPDAAAEARRALSEDAYAESMRVLSHLEDAVGEARWSLVSATQRAPR